MKKLYFISLLVFVLFSQACSSDSSDDQNENNNQENYKLLKKVTYTRLLPPNIRTMEYAYDDNRRLIKVKDHNKLYYLYYNNFNKVSKVTKCEGYSFSDINVDTFNCPSFDVDSQIYGYENERLSNINTTEYNYNSNGELISIVGSQGDDEDVFYEYDSSGNLAGMTLLYQGDSYILSYENDDKINPFYGIWHSFGFMQELQFQPYDLVRNVFKHNPEKVFNESNQGQLKMEASYQYDEDGYPVSCNFISYDIFGGNAYPGTTTFTYYE